MLLYSLVVRIGFSPPFLQVNSAKQLASVVGSNWQQWQQAMGTNAGALASLFSQGADALAAAAVGGMDRLSDVAGSIDSRGEALHAVRLGRRLACAIWLFAMESRHRGQAGLARGALEAGALVLRPAWLPHALLSSVPFTVTSLTTCIPSRPTCLQFLNSMKGDSIDQVTQQSLSEISKQLGELFNQ